MSRVKEIHYNIPQLEFHLLKSKINVCVWGRGTGKTDGPVVDFTLHNLKTLLGGNGAFVGATYEQILTRTLPSWVAGMEKFGFKLNKHFFIKKFPPERLGLEMPVRHPLKPDHYVTFHVRNRRTSGIYLISQDRPGLSNGLSFDWLVGDEAKLLNHQRLKRDTIPALRGNKHIFGDQWNHGSILFTTDMPTDPSGQWILEYEALMDKEAFEALRELSMFILQLEEQLRTVYYQPEERERKEADIAYFKAEADKARKHLVYFSTATTFDNAEVLGLETIDTFLKTLSPWEFMTSVLSLKPKNPSSSFYADFEEQVHGYEAINYSYLDAVQWDFREEQAVDCRHDSDLSEDLPLCIGTDFGARFNCAVIGQEYEEELRCLNAFYVKAPERIKEVVQQVVEYYRYRRNRHVILYYDHTAIGGDAIREEEITYKSEWVKWLELGGFTVEAIYIGQALSHDARWQIIGKALREEDADLPKIRYNKERFKPAMVSIENTKVKQDSRGMTHKDKSLEKNPDADQCLAPHFSDAFDSLFVGNMQRRAGGLFSVF